MSVEYTWKVNAVKYGNEPGFEHVIQFADCSYVATETVGLTTHTAEERVVFEFDPPSKEDFTPFNSITEELVLSWLAPKFESVTEEELESKQFKLSSIIEAKKSGSGEILSQGLPWKEEVSEETPST